MKKILIIDLSPIKNSLWKNEFVLPIVKIIKNFINYEIIHFSDLKNFKLIDLQKFNGAIISGSPLGDFTANNNLKLFEWIKKSNNPILGICSGFQIIAEIFRVKIDDIREIGLVEVKVLKENILFSKNLKTYCLHNKGILKGRNLEEFGFEILGESKDCVEAFKLKNREIYGVLFHPEVLNSEVLINFVKKLG